MARKIPHLMLFLLALTLVANTAWAINDHLLEITGNYFNHRPGSTMLCAHVEALVGPCVPVKFYGVTPWDTRVTAGPMATNSAGNVCIKTNWPQGVYRVEACIETERTMAGVLRQAESCSAPAAVSVFNPNNFCGAQGGGELHLRSYDVPPDVKTTLAARDATYAFIYREPTGSRTCPTFGVWYFDNDNPYGAVEFVARSFTDVSFGSDMDGMVAYDFVEIAGNGYFSQPLRFFMTPVHFHIYADNFPNDNWFRIEIYDFAGNLLYRSAAEDLFDELQVFEGKNIVEPCP